MGISSSGTVSSVVSSISTSIGVSASVSVATGIGVSAGVCLASVRLSCEMNNNILPEVTYGLTEPLAVVVLTPTIQIS